MAMLQDEANLSEIARLVGAESLSAQDQLTLFTSRSIREDFLHQNAFHDVDTFCSMGKQVRLLNLILAVHDRLSTALDRGAEPRDLFSLPFRERVARARYLPEDRQDEFDSILEAVSGQVAGVLGESAGAEVSR